MSHDLNINTPISGNPQSLLGLKNSFNILQSTAELIKNGKNMAQILLGQKKAKIYVVNR